MEATARVHFRIDQQTLERVDAIAREAGVTRSVLLRQMIKRWVEDAEGTNRGLVTAPTG